MKSLNKIYFICILYLYLLFILVIHPMRSDVKRIKGEKYNEKKLLPICAMALLAVGYSSVASADTGTVTKEDAAQVQQDKAKKKKRLRYSKRVMRRKSKQRKYKKK